MDDSIFAKLDQLERGARIETRPPAHAYSTQGAAILGDNEMPVEYDSESMPQAGWDVPEDVYDDQPLTLDSFGRSIILHSYASLLTSTQTNVFFGRPSWIVAVSKLRWEGAGFH